MTSSSDLPCGDETLLFADDDGTLCLATKSILEAFGYEVLPARDGEQSLEVFCARKDDLDVVISDIALPHLDGIDLYAATRQVSPDVGFIFCSGRPARDLRDRWQLDPTVRFMRNGGAMGTSPDSFAVYSIPEAFPRGLSCHKK